MIAIYTRQSLEKKDSISLESQANFCLKLINDDEELIGAALCHERTWWYKDELFIDEFFIDPECQQKGYGSKLLKYMTKYSKEQKLSGLTLMTNNLIVADFYHKNKFHDHEIYFMYKGIENIAE